MSPLPSLDGWRRFFGGARASIFDVIDAAVRVAAADDPDGLRARRDAIAERLFTALNVVSPAEATVAAAPSAAGPPTLANQEQQQQQLLLSDGAGSLPSLCSSDGAAVAPHRDSGDDPVVAEAFRVRAALSSSQQKSEAELLELLRGLQQLEFTVHTIKVTGIGKAVKELRKHSSKQIRQLVRSLIEGWKDLVNEWVSNEGAIVDHTPQSTVASCLEQEEGGLPSPPMDEAALFATPCTSIQLSETSESIPRRQINSFLQTKSQSRSGPPVDQWYDPVQNWRLDQSPVRQSITEAQGKPSSAAFGPGRPQRLHSEPEGSEMRPKQLQDISVAQSRPKRTMPNQSPPDPNSVRCKLELAKNAKLEATKRKLQEGYQEFNNAKKQRTIQMVDPQDLPKQGNRSLQPNGKPSNNTSNIRNRLDIRR